MPGLNYAQVVKMGGGGIVTSVVVKQVFGHVEKKLPDASHVERHNNTLRTRPRRFVRKGSGFSKTIGHRERLRAVQGLLQLLQAPLDADAQVVYEEGHACHGDRPDRPRLEHQGAAEFSIQE
jgi:hypothetical protein